MIDADKWTETRWPEHPCRVCGSVNDNVMGNGTPKQGDVSVCLCCTTITIFNADGSLREPTMDEINRLMNDPDVRAMAAAIHHVRQQGARTT